MRYVTTFLALLVTTSGCEHEGAAIKAAHAVGPTDAPSAAGSSDEDSTQVPVHGLLDRPQQEEEYGAVHWGRDLDAALVQSRQSGKPVFLLFTEVPGCNTVKGFANGALSHPLVVEAIEDEFIGVVVRNNVGGEERRVLESFGEPTWNNPVVRFLDHERRDLVPRYATKWSTASLVQSMKAALRSANRDVPPYLDGLAAELGARTEKTVFSMYCFWTGEVKLAGLDGVIATRPGFANGREVVEVTWDKDQTTLPKLLRQAAGADAASSVVAQSDLEMRAAQKHFERVALIKGNVRYSAKDNKYQIRRRPWGWVPMTQGQATRLNRAVTIADAAELRILSPRQRAFAQTDARFDNRGSADFSAPNAQ